MVTSHIMVTLQVAFPEVGQLSLSSLRSESDPTQIGRCCENTNSPHWLHLTTQTYFLQDSFMDKYTRNLHTPTTLADHKISCRRFLASAIYLHLCAASPEDGIHQRYRCDPLTHSVGNDKNINCSDHLTKKTHTARKSHHFVVIR